MAQAENQFSPTKISDSTRKSITNKSPKTALCTKKTAVDINMQKTKVSFNDGSIILDDTVVDPVDKFRNFDSIINADNGIDEDVAVAINSAYFIFYYLKKICTLTRV
jgi:hypothetical protein